jgi:hypothetical protein
MLLNDTVTLIAVKVLFTIIPTKELAYARKVSGENLQVPRDFQVLVDREKASIDQLAGDIRSYPGVAYVDVLQPLQQQAMQAAALYLEDENGHPVDLGYEVIGRVLAEAARPYISKQRQELVTMEVAKGQYEYFLLQDNGLYVFKSLEVIEGNGWPPGVVKMAAKEDIETLPLRGVINEINPLLYGPLGD